MDQIRTFVTFSADFPNEAQWSENGSPLVPDGQSIAVAIASSLQSVGMQASGPEQHSFYGWAFDVSIGDRTVWCLLQCPDQWLCLAEVKRSGLGRLFGPKCQEELIECVEAIDAVLKEDRRFSGIQWFTEKEYDTGKRAGARSPV